MNQPSSPLLPQATTVIKTNGDVMLEVSQHGQVLVGVNMTHVAQSIFRHLGIFQSASLADEAGR